MRLNEFYEPEEDKFQSVTVQDTRKTRLTLEQINKLRKYRDIKKAENSQHEEFVKVMYRQPPRDSGGL